MIKINKLHVEGREQTQFHHELEFLKKEEASAANTVHLSPSPYPKSDLPCPTSSLIPCC